jgi:hypothetical protein
MATWLANLFLTIFSKGEKREVARPYLVCQRIFKMMNPPHVLIRVQPLVKKLSFATCLMQLHMSHAIKK